MQSGAAVDQHNVGQFAGFKRLHQALHALGKPFRPRRCGHVRIDTRQLRQIGRFTLPHGRRDADAPSRVFGQWTVGHQICKHRVVSINCVFDEPVHQTEPSHPVGGKQQAGQAWRFEIEIQQENPLALAREDVGQHRQRGGPADAAFQAIEHDSRRRTRCALVRGTQPILTNDLPIQQANR